MARVGNKRFLGTLTTIGRSVCLVGLFFARRCDAADLKGEPTTLSTPTQELLDQIGMWQGGEEEAKLEGPYEDPRQQEIPFGRISFYLAPWRAYMDTWPARQYLDCLGINLKTPVPALKATTKVLAEAGFCSARVEIGWGNIGYYDPRQILHAQDYR